MKGSSAPQKPKVNANAVPPVFGRFAKASLATLAALLIVVAVFTWRTKGAMADLPGLRQQPSAMPNALVDETPWKTAQTLAALAVSQEEMVLARQAEHLADHEVDQTFAAALRVANLRQRTLTGEALALSQKVTQLEALVASDQAALTAIQSGPGKGSDDDQVAQAQLGLDQDQLNDAKGDLARASGDKRDEIQQQLTARETEMKKFDATGTTGEVAVISTKRYRTLVGLLSAWQKQSQRHALLLQAKAAAESSAKTLTAGHNALEAKSEANAQETAGSADRLSRLKRMGLERQLMSLYDDRIETDGQLAQVYARWATQVELQHQIVGHLLLVQFLRVLIVLAVAFVLSAAVNRWLEHGVKDVRRVRTLGWIARLSVQVVALIVILVMVFGAPSQLSTAVGLVTAGLTVALQDFILAFVGWFILMGKSGIGVGDIVEINSVQGEVIDIGLFRTTLLETGNWASTGHPTGRRVAFNNKFAISGQYFNFRTSGQWMWDEFKVTMPGDDDITATIKRVAALITTETQADTRQAELEWQQISKLHGLSQYSAEPAVNIRPAGASVDLVVRYVTRATERFERRNTLSQAVLDSLRKQEPTAHAGSV